MNKHTLNLLILLLTMLLVACQPPPEDPGTLVRLVADGREITYRINESLTVEEFLRQPNVDIEINPSDRLTPPRFTQITDGMRITIVRVEEETVCEEEEIPFETRVVLNEGLETDEERVMQVGQNGRQEVCYRVTYEDGVERQDRLRTGQPTILSEPVEEIVMVGLDREPDPVPVPGTLTYINNGNAWMIRNNSTSKRPLTTEGNLDGKVMSLSPGGQYLIYTTVPADEEAFVNELWLIEIDDNATPVQLVPTDVLTADWVPSQENTISYSTGEVQELFPYWNALNNAWVMQIDPQSGQSLNIRQLVDENLGGLSGWWGTIYKWSPDGSTLAWARADSAGIVNQRGELVPLLEYPIFRTSGNWSWRTTISWSFDSTLLAVTTHGPPLGSQPPEASPVFNVTVTDLQGTIQAKIKDSAGIWASPAFSPQLDRPDSEFAQGYLAYLRAREPYNSVNGEYDLIVADRDGSNARVVFPPSSNQAGIESQISGLTARDYTWSPDGEQLAVIYQGNLWVVDAASGVAHQLTFDGGSSYPVWTR